MNAIVDVRHYDNSYIFSPGSEGSVGDVITAFRLRQSNPDMAMRFESGFGSRCGSNVRQGDQRAYFDGGGAGKLLDTNWSNRKRMINHGYVFSNPQNTGKTCGTWMQSQGNPNWETKTAALYNARVGGEKFLPGNEFSIGSSLPRGIQTPVSTSIGSDIEVVRPPQKLKQKSSLRFK